MKKMRSVLCALTIMVSASSCGSQTDAAEVTQYDYANTALTGKVTAIDNMTVTLQLGELSKMRRNIPKEKAPADEDISQISPSADNMDERNQPTGNPEGKIAESEMTDKETGEILTEQAPKQENGWKAHPEMNRFIAGEETAVIDLATAAVTIENRDKMTEGSIDDITVDDILVVSFGEENAGIFVTIKDIPYEIEGMPHEIPSNERNGTPPEMPSNEMDNIPPENE